MKSHAAEGAWREWMKALGLQLRRTREFIGLTQHELARRSGISQGAVSRFEGGRGMSVPFIVIVRLNVALAAALGALDGSTLSEDARRYVQFMQFLKVPAGADFEMRPAVPSQTLTADPGSEDWMNLYRKASPRVRKGLLPLAQAAAEALDDNAKRGAFSETMVGPPLMASSATAAR